MSSAPQTGSRSYSKGIFIWTSPVRSGPDSLCRQARLIRNGCPIHFGLEVTCHHIADFTGRVALLPVCLSTRTPNIFEAVLELCGQKPFTAKFAEVSQTSKRTLIRICQESIQSNNSYRCLLMKQKFE